MWPTWERAPLLMRIFSSSDRIFGTVVEIGRQSREMSLLRIDDGSAVMAVTMTRKMVDQKRLTVGSQADFIVKVMVAGDDHGHLNSFEAIG